MSNIDQLIDNLAVELAALDAAEAEQRARRSDEKEADERVLYAEQRVREIQEKIRVAIATASEQRAAELAAAKPEPEGDEITPDALVKLGFKAFGRTRTYQRGLDRNSVEVHFGLDYKFCYAMALDAGNGEGVVENGVRTMADLKALYRLLTGETLAEVK